MTLPNHRRPSQTRLQNLSIQVLLVPSRDEGQCAVYSAGCYNGLCRNKWSRLEAALTPSGLVRCSKRSTRMGEREPVALSLNGKVINGKGCNPSAGFSALLGYATPAGDYFEFLFMCRPAIAVALCAHAVDSALL